MDGVGSSHRDEREETVFFTDRDTGLRGITVLDDPRLGPSVGACRSRPYIEEERALADAIRQARTTTAKALIAGLPVAGGCTVLLSNSSIGIRAASPMRALGRAVDELDGRFYLMPDLLGDLNDMDQAADSTAHLLGREGDMDLDAVEATVIGLRIGIETAVRRKLGRDSLMGVRIGIIGLGSIGFRLAELLRQEGAKLTVADRDPRRTERAVGNLGITCVATEEIIHLDMDVLAPTAAKDTIDDGILSHLRCQILAGAVDDPLQSPALGQALHDRGILYAPDTIISAGGLISLVQPLLADGRTATEHQVSRALLADLEAIGSRLDAVIDRATKESLPTAVIADRMAEEARSERLGAARPRSLAS
ncbi:MAG: NAD(P)-dependent oxidoreductase [Geminicoccaceae bacterium]